MYTYVLTLSHLPPCQCEFQYEVQPYDSLWEIAQAYGITTNELRVFNNLQGLNATELSVGQVLDIPLGAKAPVVSKGGWRLSYLAMAGNGRKGMWCL